MPWMFAQKYFLQGPPSILPSCVSKLLCHLLASIIDFIGQQTFAQQVPWDILLPPDLQAYEKCVHAGKWHRERSGSAGANRNAAGIPASDTARGRKGAVEREWGHHCAQAALLCSQLLGL